LKAIVNQTYLSQNYSCKFPTGKLAYNIPSFPALISGQRGGEFESTGFKILFKFIDWEGFPGLVKEWMPK